jgi:putative hydrolase of the HAD superfamily
MLDIPTGSLRRRGYAAVFFDAGNTLFSAYPSVGARYAEVAARFGLQADPQEVEREFRREWLKRSSTHALALAASDQAERAWWRDLVSGVFARFGALARFEEFFTELYDLFARPEAWRLYPDAGPVLAECRRRGVVTGIVSNWDSRLEGICRGLDLSGRLDFILYSALAGVAKPNPRIFELALARAGVAPDRVLHVGDSLADDVAGARAAGLDALWLRRHREDRTADVASADTLLDVLELCKEE